MWSSERGLLVRTMRDSAESTAAMKKIEYMIQRTTGWVKQYRIHVDDRPEGWLAATRLHALLDCYKALGGNVSPWRNEAGTLHRDLP